MPTIKFQGVEQAQPKSKLLLPSGPAPVARELRMPAGERSATDEPFITLEPGEDDILEIELDSGFVLWTTRDRVEQDLERSGTVQRSDDGVISLYPAAETSTERGLIRNIIRAVRMLGVDVEAVAALAAARKVESKLEGKEQFFQVGEDGSLFAGNPAPTADDQPTLVLIHGTFSSTAGAFSGFFEDNPDIWRSIFEHYEGRVYGFEHCTLTASPLKNTIEMLKALPKGANLHLVTHSRGGLVGDLIACGDVGGAVFDESDIENELKRAYGKNTDDIDAQRALYQEYNRQIARVAPNVTRYVRVAAPAAGTTLASRRLDIYLSVVINLLTGKVAVPWLSALGEFALAVIKERTDPGTLPGLEAQMPTSPLVRLLNGNRHVLKNDLTVLAGDSDGLFKNLANLFFWRANDLVVDTRSMYGGAEREHQRSHLEENRDVSHMNYFRRPPTARIVRDGLLREDGDAEGFVTSRGPSVARSKVNEGDPTEETRRPAVVLLPGIMGSHLSVRKGKRNNRIWLDKFDLLRGCGEQLEIDNKNVFASGVLAGPYDSFRDYLTREGLHVLPYPYDWRQSLESAAAKLDDLVRQRLRASDEPVYLVGHSMGGLVASLFIQRFDATWREIKNRGGRLVQAGTPNLGSFVIPQLLEGREGTLRLLAALDLGASLGDWVERIAKFPGLLELAPSFGGLDFSKPATWKKLGALQTPTPKVLSSTAAVRSVLSGGSETLAKEGALYVAGGPTPTPVYDAAAGVIRQTERGDGRVTWDSGIPVDTPTWYIPTRHGSLLDHRKSFKGLKELVLTGATNALSSEEPVASSALRGLVSDAPPLSDAAGQEVLADVEAATTVEYIPTSRDLLTSVMLSGHLDDDSDSATTGGSADVASCHVSLVHGDLRFCHGSVVVGHYIGDQIIHAEAALDGCLDGALRARHQLGIYPGKAGTAEVVIRRDNSERPGPNGAVVLGLGQIGELSPSELVRSYQTGLLRFASEAKDHGAGSPKLRLSTLLVGTGATGIDVAESLEALITAVANVNNLLDRAAPDNADSLAAPYFAEIEIVELYEDVALEALHALQTFKTHQGITVTETLTRHDGGRRRSRKAGPPPWWSWVRISGSPGETEASETLRFMEHGRRARAAGARVDVQTPLVQQLIKDAIEQRTHDDEGLQQTLFELLIPREFKRGASDGRARQLLLNRHAAAYPWELLVDRNAPDGKALSVRSGLIRQLEVGDPPPVAYAEANRILVVGDPKSGLPELRGAQAEAATVANLFDTQGGWSVVRQVRGDPKSPRVSASSITVSLSRYDYRLMHLAGHGLVDDSDPMKSGMVIGGAGTDADPYLFITRSNIEGRLTMPELVFVNCCSIGKIGGPLAENRLPLLAANLAEQFIRSGAKAVIAAGWPIDDAAAQEFCKVFYGKMLEGETFGRAVKAARNAIAKMNTTTWAAYQCYGDAGYRLLIDAKVRRKARKRRLPVGEFLDPSELLVELDNLAKAAGAKGSQAYGNAGFKEKVRVLRIVAGRKNWLGNAQMLAHFARVYAELEDFERAIDDYERASTSADGTLTLKDLEQAANLRARHGRDSDDPALIERALSNISMLIESVGATPERHAIRASAYKRLAQMASTRPQATASLEAMVEEYFAAAELNPSNLAYPLGNALFGVAMLWAPYRASKTRKTTKPKTGKAAPRRGPTRKQIEQKPWLDKADFEDRLGQLAALVSRPDHKNYWEVVGKAEYDLLHSLHHGRLIADKAVLWDTFAQAFEHSGSRRQHASTTDQWRFLRHALKRLGNADEAAVFDDWLAMYEAKWSK